MSGKGSEPRVLVSQEDALAKEVENSSGQRLIQLRPSLAVGPGSKEHWTIFVSDYPGISRYPTNLRLPFGGQMHPEHGHGHGRSAQMYPIDLSRLKPDHEIIFSMHIGVQIGISEPASAIAADGRAGLHLLDKCLRDLCRQTPRDSSHS